MPRNADGTMNGGQCTVGVAALLDVGGRIRTDFVALQAQVRAEQNPDAAAQPHRTPRSN